MRYRLLGASGASVSEIGIGALTVAQIEENAAAAEVPALSGAELQRVLPIVDGLSVPNWAGN